MRDLLLERRENAAEDSAPVISSKIFSAHPFFAGQGSDVYAERLKAITQDARILISIRDQMRILPSIYMQYLLRVGTMSHQSFFFETCELGYFGFDPLHFECDHSIARYQELFGAENILVVTQEAIKTAMDAVSR